MKFSLSISAATASAAVAAVASPLASASAILILSDAAAVAAAKNVEYSWTLKPRRASAKDPSLSVDCNLDRLMLLVNDQFPGPVIKADVGDKVIVNLINQSPTASISLHFHGLHMLGQPYKDGTATVTQCTSGPLQSQTYEFIVLDQGTHYWHGREVMLIIFAYFYVYIMYVNNFLCSFSMFIRHKHGTW
jgi:FtsP/CotA-like multicopper oxidase with cupredoxin domain